MQNGLSCWSPASSSSQMMCRWYHGLSSSPFSRPSTTGLPLLSSTSRLCTTAISPWTTAILSSLLSSFQSLGFHPTPLFSQLKAMAFCSPVYSLSIALHRGTGWSPSNWHCRPSVIWQLSTSLSLIFLEVVISSPIWSNFRPPKTPWYCAINKSMPLLTVCPLLNTDLSFKIRFKDTYKRCLISPEVREVKTLKNMFSFIWQSKY